MRRIVTPEQALERLERLCARAEHCESEMRLKLRKMGISADDADKIIDSLRRDRYIDDERFAHAYVREKMVLGYWGRRKVAYALSSKRISREAIDQAMEQIDDDEYAERLMRLAKARVKRDPEMIETPLGRTRMYAYLMQRGYEGPLVHDIITELKKEANP